ncbi:type VI secretion system baseplate subunit TssE [Trabulsiella odontotermitis]|uniref:type VI secretion system baseplate subunit TssE n=1 Tax=Trabulsiella odontotermitis TaxID=379893 RepID=UPI0006BA3262|nr:type VI secretion system baseplate subunit TssE [Trabulsiella odontotermitis]
MNANFPSLYEVLTGHFTGGISIEITTESDQVILSVMDNIQRILNSRAAGLLHLPDYGLPDMATILQGMPGTANQQVNAITGVLLKYEPRLQSLNVTLLEQKVPGELRYAIDAELKEIGLVRYSTEFIAGGKVMLRHLKSQ